MLGVSLTCRVWFLLISEPWVGAVAPVSINHTKKDLRSQPLNLPKYSTGLPPKLWCLTHPNIFWQNLCQSYLFKRQLSNDVSTEPPDLVEGQLLSWCYRFIFASHISILLFISSIADTKGPRSHTLLTEPERKKLKAVTLWGSDFVGGKWLVCGRKFPWIEWHVPTMAQKQTSVVLFRFSSVSLVNAYAKPIGKYFGALAWSTAWSFPKGTLMCLSKEISTGTLHAVAQRMLIIDDSMLEWPQQIHQFSK